MNYFAGLLCSLFLIGCKGDFSDEPIIVTPPVPLPAPTLVSLFNTSPIVLNDPQSYYSSTCGNPVLSSIIPLDINGDNYDDFVIHMQYENYLIHQGHTQQ